jgi:hypothetical protein
MGQLSWAAFAWKEEEYSIREEVGCLSTVVSGLLILCLCMLSTVGPGVLECCLCICFKI